MLLAHSPITDLQADGRLTINKLITEVIMQSGSNPLFRVISWFMAPIGVLLFAFPLHAQAGDTETNAVKYCISSGAVEPDAFVYCVGSYLTTSEIKKCLSGGDCFGESNDLRKALQSLGVNFDDIGRYGWCGGPNSEARKIFGNGVCGCGGPERSVKIENTLNQPVGYIARGSCSNSTIASIPAGSTLTLSGEGDEWFNFAVISHGGTAEHGLDPGFRYSIEQDGAQVKIHNSTPRFNPYTF